MRESKEKRKKEREGEREMVREKEGLCTPTRIPSRLGEPGSLFSRYKFLQLQLVVVTLLTGTRRELLNDYGFPIVTTRLYRTFLNLVFLKF